MIPAQIAEIRETGEADIETNYSSIGNQVHYSLSRKISSGRRGTNVFFGFFEKTRPVAVKRVVRDSENGILDEARFLLRLDGHPNILRYYCTGINENFMYSI